MGTYSPLPGSSQDMACLSWTQIEPFYSELAKAPLSEDTLTAWLTQWSRLSDLLEETQMCLWIECMRDTTSAERGERRRRFDDEVGVRAAAFDRQLGRRLAECGAEPEGFALSMRNARALAGQEDDQELLKAQERLLIER